MVIRLSSVEIMAPSSTASTPMNGRVETAGGAYAARSLG